ncbi:MAG: hypothetical protein ACOCU6_02650 [Nanoarchaeota archaeon]
MVELNDLERIALSDTKSLSSDDCNTVISFFNQRILYLPLFEHQKKQFDRLGELALLKPFPFPGKRQTYSFPEKVVLTGSIATAIEKYRVLVEEMVAHYEDHFNRNIMSAFHIEENLEKLDGDDKYFTKRLGRTHYILGEIPLLRYNLIKSDKKRSFSEKLYLLERVHSHKKASAFYGRVGYPLHSLYAYISAAKAARGLFNMFFKPKNDTLDFFLNSRKALYWASEALLCAELSFERSVDSYEKNIYKSRNEQAHLKTIAHCARYAGDAAKNIAVFNNDASYARTALEWYALFNEYIDKTFDSSCDYLRDFVKRDMDSLSKNDFFSFKKTSEAREKLVLKPF